MKISEDERLAVYAVLVYGEAYGYGNLISHLQTAWALRLMKSGIDEKAARAGAGGQGYPFQMHRDIVERGEWDETGERYRQPKKAKKSRQR